MEGEREGAGGGGGGMDERREGGREGEGNQGRNLYFKLKIDEEKEPLRGGVGWCRVKCVVVHRGRERAGRWPIISPFPTFSFFDFLKTAKS
jgi:hypothetical protein